MKVFNLVGWLSVVHAALIFTDRTWTNVVTGVPFVVTWSGNVGAVTLKLDNGTAGNPNVVHHIQCKYISILFLFSGLVSNSYIWTPGLFATPGDEFFLSLNDSTGAQTFSPHFVIAASQSSTSIASSTSTATTSPTTSSSQTPLSAPPSAASNGPSSGAKIGIAAGVAGGVILLAALVGLALLWEKRKRNTKRNTSFEMDGTTRYDGFEVLEKSPRGGTKKGVYNLALATDEGVGTGELEGEARHELQ